MKVLQLLLISVGVVIILLVTESHPKPTQATPEEKRAKYEQERQLREETKNNEQQKRQRQETKNSEQQKRQQRQETKNNNAYLKAGEKAEKQKKQAEAKRIQKQNGMSVKIHRKGQWVVEAGDFVELTCEYTKTMSGYYVRWNFQPANSTEFILLAVGTTKYSMTHGEYEVYERMNRYLNLAMPYVTVEMSGLYICDITSMDTSVTGDHVNLTIKAPHASMANRKVGELGQLTEFVCRYDGVKAWQSVKWTRKTNKYLTRESNSPGMSMRMTNSYSYWTLLLTQFYNGTSDKHFRENTIANRVEHVTRTHLDGSSTFHLIISDLVCEDNGTFQCSVASERGVSPTSSKLVITAAPSMPTIEGGPPTGVPQGTSITLRCSANVGIPAGVLSWYQQLVGRTIQKIYPRNSETYSAGDCTYKATSSIVIGASRDMHHAVFTCFSHRVGTLATLSQTAAHYTLIVGGEPILPTLSMMPNTIVPLHGEIRIQCSLPANTSDTLLTLYRLCSNDKHHKTATQNGDHGNLVAYTDPRGVPAIMDAEKYKGRLKVIGDRNHFSFIVTKVTCGDACAYRCGATRFSNPIPLSVVDLTQAVTMDTRRCQETIDDDVDCDNCPYLARVGQELTVTCTGRVSFPDAPTRSRFVWWVKGQHQPEIQPVSNSTVLGAVPISDVTHSDSGCYPERKTSLLIYTPTIHDGDAVSIGCELVFYAEGLQHTQRAEVDVCVRKGFSLSRGASLCQSFGLSISTSVIFVVNAISLLLLEH